MPARVRPAAVERWKRQLGERLREARTAKGMSQLELSARTGLSQPFISDIEQGRRNVTIVTVHVLAAALRIEAGDLLARDA